MNLKELMDQMNYNLHARERTGKSMLPEIQARLVKVMMTNSEMTEEQKQEFEQNLYFSPEIFDNSAMYSGLPQVREVLKTFKSMNQIPELVEEQVVEVGRSR